MATQYNRARRLRQKRNEHTLIYILFISLFVAGLTLVIENWELILMIFMGSFIPFGSFIIAPKTKLEITEYQPAYIHEDTDPLHCATCYTGGTSTPRYYVKVRWNGSEIEWLYTFPCSRSRYEFIEEIKQDAEVLENGYIQ